jgi:hypothetical protein
MAYYIFLKSLRSPEEFMKNPHIKIPPKSPPTNFQSLCIFKKSKIYSEIILLKFRPIRPSLPRAGPLHLAGHRSRARPTRPEQPWRICQKVPLLRVCTVQKQHFLSLLSLPSGPRPIVPAPSSRRSTAGMLGEAAMAEPWDGVGKAAMTGTHKAHEGASGWVRCSRWW